MEAAVRVKAHGWRDLGVTPLPMGCSAKMYTKGPCRVLVSQEPRRNGIMRWHLSISCADRYPSWKEIKDARYSLLPMGLTFTQLLPPANEYVNIYSNCFHLWEIGDNEW